MWMGITTHWLFKKSMSKTETEFRSDCTNLILKAIHFLFSFTGYPWKSQVEDDKTHYFRNKNVAGISAGLPRRTDFEDKYRSLYLGHYISSIWNYHLHSVYLNLAVSSIVIEWGILFSFSPKEGFFFGPAGYSLKHCISVFLQCVWFVLCLGDTSYQNTWITCNRVSGAAG